jgi:hypothetical protein
MTTATWTQFHDSHSGGNARTRWHKIYVEAPEAEARAIFAARLNQDPDAVACSCCGKNFMVCDYATLTEATAYERNCECDEDSGEYFERQRAEMASVPYRTLAEYMTDPGVLFLRAPDFVVPCSEHTDCIACAELALACGATLDTRIDAILSTFAGGAS